MQTNTKIKMWNQILTLTAICSVTFLAVNAILDLMHWGLDILFIITLFLSSFFLGLSPEIEDNSEKGGSE